MNKQCQNCKNEFEITDEDTAFYRKIDVPAPTFCPECRTKRRYVWRNERSLYKRKCNAPGHNEEIVSMYAPDGPYTIYDDRYWWSDDWDALNYGKDYDFEKPFFEQYDELLKEVPLISVSVTNNKDCNYCNVSAEDKECYMISASGLNENSMYSNRIAFSKDCVDVYISQKNSGCYGTVDCNNSYNLLWSEKCSNCIDSYFLYDCINCQNCFLCTGLRNKKYNILNKQYSKEDYEKELKKLFSGGFSQLQQNIEKLSALKNKSINRFAYIINSVNSTGDNVHNSKNAVQCFDCWEIEDSKFCTWSFSAKDSYDLGPGSWDNIQLMYDSWDANFSSSRIKFSGVIYSCHDVFYSWNCHSSHDLFGCYGLRNKEYCILNKQYSKEEYMKLLPKIIQHMKDMPYVDSRGVKHEFGGFFPQEISPFGYNETVAHEYFPADEDVAKLEGFHWRQKSKNKYNPTLASKDLPDNIGEVDESILNEIISCFHDDKKSHPYKCEAVCSTAFRIIPEELSFYKQKGIPLPRLCYNCRHYGRLSQRNPMKLWLRKCQCAGSNSENSKYTNTSKSHPDHAPDEHCLNEFQTSYSPDRPEIVYCESCYQAEIL